MNSGWKCAELLSKIDSTTDFYFDSVSQIKMENWSKGRVTLVGDACDCPSLLSGKGSTLAMVGSYILAGELKQANGNYKTAFEQYQNIFKPFMNKKQKAAQSFAKSFRTPMTNSSSLLSITRVPFSHVLNVARVICSSKSPSVDFQAVSDDSDIQIQYLRVACCATGRQA